jgi:hypothetical protein
MRKTIEPPFSDKQGGEGIRKARSGKVSPSAVVRARSGRAVWFQPHLTRTEVIQTSLMAKGKGRLLRPTKNAACVFAVEVQSRKRQ